MSDQHETGRLWVIGDWPEALFRNQEQPGRVSKPAYHLKIERGSNSLDDGVYWGNYYRILFEKTCSPFTRVFLIKLIHFARKILVQNHPINTKGKRSRP